MLAAVLVAFSAGAQAQDWVELPQPHPQPQALRQPKPQPNTESLHLDRSSVAAAGEERYAAVWRMSSATGRRQIVRRGLVDCRAESLQALTATEVSTDPAPGSYTGAVVDYRAGSRRWQGATTRLTDAERAAAYDFPAPGSASARLVEAVCADRSAAWRKRTAGAVATVTGKPDDPTVAAAGDATAFANAAALDLRLRQLQDACHLDPADLQRIRSGAAASSDALSSDALSSDAATSDAATPVATSPGSALPVQRLLADIGGDLARAAAGLPCSRSAERLAQASDDDAVAAARSRFQACVGRVLPELDDRVSDADVVAAGVFGACRGELPKSIAQGTRFARGLMPELTAAVLEHRRLLGRVTLPTRPRRPQAE